MSKTIRYVECAHYGETIGTYYITCPYCGYRLVDAKQAVMDGQDQLAYKHQSNHADILRTLKLKAEVNQ